MQQWIYGVSFAMLQEKNAELNLEINHGGGLYRFHHCIHRVTPAMNPVGEIIRTKQ